MSKLQDLVIDLTKGKAPTKKAPKVTFGIRLESSLKDEAQALFGKNINKVVEVALQEAIDIAKGSKS